MGRLENKVALISGGSRGMGAAEAEMFAAEGAHVVIADILEDEGRKTASKIAETGARCLFTNLDVLKASDWESAISTVTSAFGKLDILVNNAGIGGPKAPLEDISYEEWDRTIGVNLNGMFYCIKNVAPYMKAQESGCIVNISTASAKVALPLRSPYVASKAGVLGLTHTVAREYGPFGIRCNAILPGLIYNERGRRIVADQAAERGISVEAREAEFLEYISLK